MKYHRQRARTWSARRIEIKHEYQYEGIWQPQMKRNPDSLRLGWAYKTKQRSLPTVWTKTSQQAGTSSATNTILCWSTAWLYFYFLNTLIAKIKTREKQKLMQNKEKEARKNKQTQQVSEVFGINNWRDKCSSDLCQKVEQNKQQQTNN